MYSEKVIERLKESVNQDLLRHGPISVQVLPSGKCNAECAFCAIHSRKVPRHIKETYAPRLIPDGKFLDFTLYRQFVDDLAELGLTRRIQYTGLGDPLMHPRFSEMVSYAREKLPETFLVAVTNGIALGKQIRGILNSGLDQLTLSLNAGQPSTWVKLNRKGSERQFERIIEALITIDSEREGEKPRVVITAVLTRHNYRDVPKMVEIARKCNIRIIGFSRMMPFIFGDFCANTDLLLSPGQFREFEESIREANAANSDVVVYLWGEGPDDGSLNARVQGSLPPCYAGWWFAMLYPDGGIYPCCNCETRLGDMTKTNFKDIWNGKLYRKFREQALQIPKSGGMKDCLCEECGFFTENKSYHKLVS